MNDARLIHVGKRVLRARAVGAGAPVVYAHGALGSILELPVPEAVLSKLGVRLVLVERPGYGASTRHEGRSLATWVDDLCVVLDELGLPKVRVLGWAAGVPHAMAAAALAPTRVASLSLVSPWFKEEDVDPSSPSAVAAYKAEIGRTFGPLIELIVRDPDAGLDAILAQMPEPDRGMAPETRAMLAASYAEATRQGREPPIDEALAIHTRWPFAIEAVACEVEVWSGEADVRAASCLRLLARRLPRARQRAIAGAGHYLPFTHGETILSSLASLSA